METALMLLAFVAKAADLATKFANPEHVVTEEEQAQADQIIALGNSRLDSPPSGK